MNARQQHCLRRFIYMNGAAQRPSERVQPPTRISDVKIGREPVAHFPEGLQRVRGTRARYLSGVDSPAVRQLDELLALIRS